MSALSSFITLIYRFINTLLPFTNPGTPVSQDIVHTAAVCALLYYAPRYFEQRQRDIGPGNRTTSNANEEESHQDVHATTATVEGHFEGLLPHHEHIAGSPAPIGLGPIPRDDIHLDSDSDTVNGEENVEAHPDAPDPHAQEDLQQDEFNPQDNQQQQTALPNTRVVGTKKARSLARRSQRRAYNEFLRSQGEATRAAAAAEAAQHEANAAQERSRRSAADAAAEMRLAEERQTRKELALAKAEKEEARTRTVIAIVRKRLLDVGMVDIEKDVLEYVDELDADKVANIVRAAGIERTRTDDKKTISTLLLRSKYIVNIDEELMSNVYHHATTDTAYDLGKVTWEDLAKILEDLILKRSTINSSTAPSSGTSPSILQSLRVAIQT